MRIAVRSTLYGGFRLEHLSERGGLPRLILVTNALVSTLGLAVACTIRLPRYR